MKKKLGTIMEGGGDLLGSFLRGTYTLKSTNVVLCPTAFGKGCLCEQASMRVAEDEDEVEPWRR